MGATAIDTNDAFARFCVEFAQLSHPAFLRTYLEIFQLIDTASLHKKSSTLALQSMQVVLAAIEQGHAMFPDFDLSLCTTARLIFREHQARLEERSSAKSMSLAYLQEPKNTLSSLSVQDRALLGLYLVTAELPPVQQTLNPFEIDMLK